jgi:hypothetical protein
MQVMCKITIMMSRRKTESENVEIRNFICNVKCEEVSEVLKLISNIFKFLVLLNKVCLPFRRNDGKNRNPNSKKKKNLSNVRCFKMY